MNTCESRQHHLKHYKIYILNRHTHSSVISERQRQIQIVSHKNNNLNGSEGFVIFLTSKSITCFIDGFTLIMTSQSIAYLLNESEHIYILKFGPWRWSALNMEFYNQAAFKNARTTIFSKLGRAGNNFHSGSKISREGCPRPDRTPPKFVRGCLMSALNSLNASNAASLISLLTRTILKPHPMAPTTSIHSIHSIPSSSATTPSLHLGAWIGPGFSTSKSIFNHDS